MAKQVSEVTLRIEWDDDEDGRPCDCWDWAALIDCSPDAVSVIGCNCHPAQQESK